ncbi:MAG: alpha/beta hydrolase [Betaproteobacteria bacterium]|nr:alpha/beta hydrolase [Betaproteobacteria bacterium]
MSTATNATPQPATLDPGCASFLAALAEQGGLGPPELGILRSTLVDLAAAATPGPDMADIVDFKIPLSGRNLPARRYRPLAGACKGLVVFFHGGGFVAGTIETHDELCRQIAAASSLDLLSVEYRLAPEHPWPAAPEDALEAVRWVLTNQSTLGIPAGKIAVAGDSAGGTLAAICALELGSAIRAIAMIYPLLDATSFDDNSMHTLGDGYFLTREMMLWFMEQYLPAGTIRTQPRVSPGLSPAWGKAPPVILLTAGFDPLVDHQLVFDRNVRDQGGRIEHLQIKGAIHGFVSLREEIGSALVDTAINFISTQLARTVQ